MDEQKLREDLERVLEEVSFEELLIENDLTEVDVLVFLFENELITLPFWIKDCD